MALVHGTYSLDPLGDFPVSMLLQHGTYPLDPPWGFTCVNVLQLAVITVHCHYHFHKGFFPVSKQPAATFLLLQCLK